MKEIINKSKKILNIKIKKSFSNILPIVPDIHPILQEIEFNNFFLLYFYYLHYYIVVVSYFLIINMCKIY